MDGSPALDLWDLEKKCSILVPTNSRNPKREYRETCCVTHHQAVGFCLGLALAMVFPEAMSSSLLVSIDSVTYLSTPFTILIQEKVLSSNRDGI